MTIAFCLYKYFPFGGLQRDFLRIALACQARGHAIRVYTLEWRGEIPAGFEVIVVPVKALTNPRRYAKFSAWIDRDLAKRKVERVVGFNKMPNLDVYFAADPCYEDKARTLRNPLYRLSARYRHFAAFERAVFGATAKTEILILAQRQKTLFQQYHGTADARFHLLPPGIAGDRRAPDNAHEIRAAFRREFALADDALLVLQIGSGFKTKGLDRSLKALAALPPDLARRSRLIAIGDDDPKPFIRQARALALTERVRILRGRGDIPRFLLGADLLIHPAYNETAGMVLLEAVVAGLPVLTTAVCGYAHYIADADAGLVLAEPFEQTRLDEMLARMLNDAPARARWQANGLAFAARAAIYGNAERAADLIEQARR
ncbi:MAG TPA: glycosyltransferase family 4 protein [Accumulibacter sp.]|jgi:UDP-glucose:(heptosyl)LPS alpha-1,3-glucosyltransferase|nr:glycosyltransferase family 4 protein [Accumulibacter sp.]HQC80356.1 glycosyltransferase family 4 protein [Accumulibacter sp.]